MMAVLFSLLFTSLQTQPAHALDLFLEPRPQARLNTCQSYSMVLSLSLLDEGGFSLDNFGQLRAAELRFRSILEALPGGYTSHQNWVRAVETCTSGRYTLALEYPQNIVEWMRRVQELTSLTSSVDVMISRLTGTRFPVVMTSVTQFCRKHLSRRTCNCGSGDLRVWA